MSSAGLAIVIAAATAAAAAPSSPPPPPFTGRPPPPCGPRGSASSKHINVALSSMQCNATSSPKQTESSFQRAASNHFNYLESRHQSSPFVAQDGCSGVKNVYDGHIKGYAGCFTEDVIEELRGMPEVDFIEKDQIVRTADELAHPDIIYQKGAPWGLARVSHRPKLTFGTFSKYEYHPDGGEGVTAFVIDTGIDHTHPEFEGRASWGKTIPKNDADEDANGHGTHCAGTIASSKYGVAKKANVVAVKVLGSNGSGTMSDVIEGVLFAGERCDKIREAAEKEAKTTGKNNHKGCVANMSLGGGKSPALDKAVNKLVESGVFMAVAAGNENKNACNSSPAAAEKAMTVAASTLGDDRAYFSNYGECVDIHAPGLNILSTWPEERTNTISGTSMASPHVCGMAAYLLSILGHETFNPELPEYLSIESQSSFSIYAVAHAALPGFITHFFPPPRVFESTAPIPKYPKITPIQLKKAMLDMATRGALSDVQGSPNLLLFNNATVA